MNYKNLALMAQQEMRHRYDTATTPKPSMTDLSLGLSISRSTISRIMHGDAVMTPAQWEEFHLHRQNLVPAPPWTKLFQQGRDEAGFLAGASGLAKSAVTQYLSGKKFPGKKNAEILAFHTGIPVEVWQSRNAARVRSAVRWAYIGI